MDSKGFVTQILNWFTKHGRKNLPWQQNISAYRVWLSEIMLQQTQVSTVTPYFQLFIEKFPRIELLAHAELDEVLHLWTGLGYYARARNLHKTAQIITTQFNGVFPNTLDALQQLPGIGKSTAGAILAIAFKKQASILDGNVKRVLSRFYAIEEPINSGATQQQLWQLAENLTPEQNVAEYTQAMMDLGATICIRSQPKCVLCPLLGNCQAYAQNRVKDFPKSSKSKKLPTKARYFLVVSNASGDALLTKREANGIWGGLWSFPECAKEENPKEWFWLNYQHELKKLKIGKEFRHSFSHFHLDITPVYAHLENFSVVMDSTTKLWYNIKNPPAIGLATPVKRLLAKLNEE